MVKSYLRTRLFKIEKHLLYLVEKDQASLLSEGEMQFAWSLYENKKGQFSQAFFNKIPSRLNMFEQDTLDDRLSKYYTLFNFVVTKPNEQEFVFVKFLKEYERYSLNIEIEIRIRKDAIYFLPYVAVK